MKLTRRLFTSTAMASIVIARTGGSARADEPRKGGTLVMVSADNVRHFNPAVQSGTVTGIPGAQIFASPIRFDDGWEPKPYLAESWEWGDDGLSFTMHLRQDAKFSDGVAITSADVKYSLEVNKENHPFKSKFSAVADIETPDDFTVVLRLSAPHPALLLALSPAMAPIIPKHIYDDGQDIKTHPRNADPVASGPFKVKEFKQGEYVLLERNEHYVLGDGPYLDQILINIVSNVGSHGLGLTNGEYHLATVSPLAVRDWKRLGEEPNLTASLAGYEAIGPLNWLAFNTKKPPFDNKLVRQAISFAIDRDFIVNTLHAGGTTRATGPIANGNQFYTDEVEHYDLNLDKANSLLDEAGFPMNGESRFSAAIDFIPGYDEQQKLIAEYLRPQLAKIGIDLEVRTSVDFGAWADRISNWNFDMTMDNVYNWGDPVIGVHRTYLSDNIVEGVIWSNTQQYSNPEVDQLLKDAGIELDLDKRKALYKEFQRIVVDDVPIAYINNDSIRTIYSNKVGNPELGIWGAMAPMDRTYLTE